MCFYGLRRVVLIVVLVLFGMCLGSVAPAADKSITLNFEWGQDISPDFGGWKLYSATKSGGPYAAIATVLFVAQQTTYTASQPVTAPDAAETKLFFVLAAYDKSGNESPYSNEASFTADFLPPGAPFNLKVVIKTQ